MDSLIHNMTRDQKRIVEGISIGQMDYKESVQQALEEASTSKKKQTSTIKTDVKDVRAISRVVLPKHMNMSALAEIYANFLNKITLNIVNSNFDEEAFIISLPLLKKELLLLEKDTQTSDEDRVSYKIIGGDFALAHNGGNARLEFRRLPNSDSCIIALQEYEPTLPWWVYKYTQAKVHKSVMNLFKFNLYMKRHNQKLSSVTKQGLIVGAVLGALIVKSYKSRNY